MNRVIKTALVLFIGLGAVSFCKASGAPELIGKWVVDMEAMKKINPVVRVQLKDPRMAKRYEELVKGLSISITNTELTARMAMMGQAKTDKLKILSVTRKGKQITLKTRDTRGKEALVPITVTDRDHIILNLGPQKVFALKRKK